MAEPPKHAYLLRSRKARAEIPPTPRLARGTKRSRSTASSSSSSSSASASGPHNSPASSGPASRLKSPRRQLASPLHQQQQRAAVTATAASMDVAAAAGLVTAPVAAAAAAAAEDADAAVAPPSTALASAGYNEETQRLGDHFHAIEDDLSRHDFVLRETLGTGTFGRVRLVKYVLDGQDVFFALKMLAKTTIVRLKQVDHIKAEKRILRRIFHPFVVNLLAAFQDATHLYMLLEYVIGGELFSLLRKTGRFRATTATFYAAEIALALEHLHCQDIVYRDLKPENLLIDAEGHMKITDFGFAKVVADRTWTLCGTPEYLAPEIIHSKGHGKAVDMWALGVLLYEMMAGYPPFYDEHAFGIYQKILAGRIEFPRCFDAPSRDVVRGLLTADRAKRLGCKHLGAEDLKEHIFFDAVDWELCFNRGLTPPSVPTTRGADDTSYFAKYDEADDFANAQALTGDDATLFDDF